MINQNLTQQEAAAAMFHLQTGEELGQLGEERQEDKSDEAGLRRRFGHFVSVHEGSHRKSFELLRVALRPERREGNTSVK